MGSKASKENVKQNIKKEYWWFCWRKFFIFKILSKRVINNKIFFSDDSYGNLTHCFNINNIVNFWCENYQCVGVDDSNEIYSWGLNNVRRQ